MCFEGHEKFCIYCLSAYKIFVLYLYWILSFCFLLTDFSVDLYLFSSKCRILDPKAFETKHLPFSQQCQLLKPFTLMKEIKHLLFAYMENVTFVI